MNVKINPTPLFGKVNAQPSKSFAHRILIGAFLSGQKVRVKISDISKDISATCRALQAFGAEITFNAGEIIISRGALPDREVTIDAGESGSTLRFSIPLAAALGVRTKFIGSKRLLERPLTPLISVLIDCGVRVESSSEYILVDGKLDKKELSVDGSLSSQYVTGLLLALAAIGGGRLNILGKRTSSGYVDITLSVLKEFGVKVVENENSITLSGKMSGVSEISVEGDWSNAAFFLAAGVIGGRVEMRGLNLNSTQGDREIVDAIRKFGGNIRFENGVVIAEKSRLTGCEIDIDKIPDLGQILSVIAAFAKGQTVLKRVDRLRIKETDRVEAIISNLKAAGIIAEYDKSNLYITGGVPTGGEFLAFNDHRAVMSAAVTAAYAKGQSVINGAEAVDKSYPRFFNDYRALTGE